MKTTPICPTCGGATECILRGGQMQDPNNPEKWIACNVETWRCVAARETLEAARARANRSITAEYGAHARGFRVVV